MPLHDWTEDTAWEGMHHFWITHLVQWIKPRLPSGYRAYVGSVPSLAIGGPAKPDVSVRSGGPSSGPSSPNGVEEVRSAAVEEPTIEVAVATLDPEKAVFVVSGGRLVAAVELVSPRNKDRPASRETYTSRYTGYLLSAANLLLVDVHPRPVGFSFADGIAGELQMEQPSLPPPFAMSYRVGEPAASGGRLLALWRRPLQVGKPLPILPLALAVHSAVQVDLEQTYMQAAADAYLA